MGSCSETSCMFFIRYAVKHKLKLTSNCYLERSVEHAGGDGFPTVGSSHSLLDYVVAQRGPSVVQRGSPVEHESLARHLFELDRPLRRTRLVENYDLRWKVVLSTTSLKQKIFFLIWKVFEWHKNSFCKLFDKITLHKTN